ncbi:hypothetical protein AS189_11890 [Arthrobacter alpinus]|uniref:Uncharacterized protein n=1 Tax=Arthrobacter alpinus TaxID=656366 RepID=A0A0S2M010_9MICC|nr:hypothetical protein [Arthrobacter alpinus]ALO67069.1 hypothetical protein AS189_11890 [Arthrobacter alpinus]
MRVIPAVFVALAIASGLLIPRVDSLYLLGHAAAMVFALATPLCYWWRLRSNPQKSDGVSRFLLIGLAILGLLSAVASGLLLSMGSSMAAAGDIGGMFLWVCSTWALLILSIAAIFVNAPRSSGLSV